MATTDVDPDWALHSLLLRIFAEAVNGNVILDGPFRNVPKMPSDPDEWTSWAIQVNHLITIREVISITESALADAEKGLAAAHQLAAAVMLPELTDDQVSAVLNSLAKLNDAIKNDERFHAALAMGKAISKQIVEARDGTT